MPRLDKYLADSLSQTRSEVKKIIKQGKVYINGMKAVKPEQQVAENDEVMVNGKPVSYQEFFYYMFHKPAGCVTANEDKQDKTVFDYLKDAPGKKLSAVGRLDKDTEGLLIITNDGEYNHRLMAPGKHVSKTYYCRLDHELSAEDIESLETGVDIGDDKLTVPAKVHLVDNEKSACMLTITEGRFHQVKRMMEAVGNQVTYLKRIAIGNLELDDNLQPGEYRTLSEEERKKSLESV